MATSDQEPDTATEFATVLIGHNRGIAHTALSKLLKDAVDAVRQTGRKAKVGVEFTISPMKNNKRVVQLADRVTSTIPEEKVDSIWFADDEGGLHRNDPQQLRMEYGGEPTTTTANTERTN